MKSALINFLLWNNVVDCNSYVAEMIAETSLIKPNKELMIKNDQ